LPNLLALTNTCENNTVSSVAAYAVGLG